MRRNKSLGLKRKVKQRRIEQKSTLSGPATQEDQ